MKGFATRVVPVFLVCIGLMAGCAAKQDVTEEMGARAGDSAMDTAQTETVPEDTTTMGAEDMASEPMGETTEMARVEEEKTTEAAMEEALELRTVHFEFDKYNIRDEDKDVLRKNAGLIKRNPGAKVVIEGHADERGETEYNLALGEKRAKSVKSFLVDMGVDPSRLATISYGEEKPKDPRHNEAAWFQNRRAEFQLK